MAKGGNSVRGGNNPGVSNGCKNAGPSAVGHNPHCTPTTDSNVGGSSGGGGGTVVNPNPVTNVVGGALTDQNRHVSLLEVTGAGSCSDSSRDPYFYTTLFFGKQRRLRKSWTIYLRQIGRLMMGASRLTRSQRLTHQFKSMLRRVASLFLQVLSNFQFKFRSSVPNLMALKS